MWKLYENFYIFYFQKRIVSAETIRGNTVYLVNIKSKVEISSIFVAFLEYLNFTVLIYTVPNAIVFSQIFPWLIVKPKSTAHSWSILTKAAKQFPPFKEAATATYVPPK